jgi:hypothetical protein
MVIISVGRLVYPRAIAQITPPGIETASFRLVPQTTAPHVPLIIGSGYFRAKISCINAPKFSTPVILHTYPPMKMEQTVFRNVGVYNKDAGESPTRKDITFRTRRQF